MEKNQVILYRFYISHIYFNAFGKFRMPIIECRCISSAPLYYGCSEYAILCRSF